MILPSKKLNPENSLIHIGGIVLNTLSEPKTVSRVWQEFKETRIQNPITDSIDLTYDWFILSLDLLFIFGAIGLRQGRLHRRSI